MASPLPTSCALEAQRCRHRAVAIPIVTVGGLIAVGTGQQRAHAQKLDFIQDESGVGWHGGQPLYSGSRLAQVCAGAVLQQRFH
jgi:hypothetical protein